MLAHFYRPSLQCVTYYYLIDSVFWQLTSYGRSKKDPREKPPLKEKVTVAIEDGYARLSIKIFKARFTLKKSPEYCKLSHYDEFKLKPNTRQYYSLRDIILKT